LGKWEGVGNLEILTFMGLKWHSPNGSMPFHRAQKSLDFQGPTLSPFALIMDLHPLKIPFNKYGNKLGARLH
jgi:hypothetical protein